MQEGQSYYASLWSICLPNTKQVTLNAHSHVPLGMYRSSAVACCSILMLGHAARILLASVSLHVSSAQNGMTPIGDHLSKAARVHSCCKVHCQGIVHLALQ